MIGYNLADTYDSVVNGFSYAGYVVVALAVVAVAVIFWHRYRTYKAEQVRGRHQRLS